MLGVNMIFALSGPDASGKTSIARGLLEFNPCLSMVLSTTTRDPRPTDLPGEYEYVSEEEFGAMLGRGEFQWTTEVRGKKYGTRRRNLKKALAPGKFGLMIVTPDTVVLAKKLFPGHDKIYSIYVLPPDINEHKRRLAEDRKWAIEDIEKSILRGNEWTEAALSSNSFDLFIRNEEGKLQETIYEADRTIKLFC